VPRFAIAPLGLTTEGSIKFKPKGWKRYLKKLQCLGEEWWSERSADKKRWIIKRSSFRICSYPITAGILLTGQVQLPLQEVGQQQVQQIPPEQPGISVSESCLGCICEAVSNCNQTVRCEGDVCGVFRITRGYWIDAGQIALQQDNTDGKPCAA